MRVRLFHLNRQTVDSRSRERARVIKSLVNVRIAIIMSTHDRVAADYRVGHAVLASKSMKAHT